jgi:hypothetical protein
MFFGRAFGGCVIVRHDEGDNEKAYVFVCVWLKLLELLEVVRIYVGR